MRTTVIITESKDNPNRLSRSLVSLIESSKVPSNVCMIYNSQVNDNEWATARAIMGGCCGSKTAEEVITDECITVTNQKYNTNFYAIKLNNKKGNDDLKNFAIQKLKDQTDVFFTLSSGTAYGSELIEKYLAKLEDPLIKGVYSDYYVSGKEVYLQSFHAMMNSKIDVREFAFKTSDLSFKGDSFSFLSDLYTIGIISHIPEFLYSV